MDYVFIYFIGLAFTSVGIEQIFGNGYGFLVFGIGCILAGLISYLNDKVL